MARKYLDPWQKKIQNSTMAKLWVYPRVGNRFLGRVIKRQTIPGMKDSDEAKIWETEVGKAEKGLRRFLDSRWEGKSEYEVEVEYL